MITSLEEFLGKMQRGLCCQVCTELLYQPFNLSCGHVFCYGCLVDWFKEAKRCPTCRERVTEKPTVSYLVPTSITNGTNTIRLKRWCMRMSEEQNSQIQNALECDGIKNKRKQINKLKITSRIYSLGYSFDMFLVLPIVPSTQKMAS